MIFVDDSNVWIEAQKFAASGNSHMPKLKDNDRDPRLRINIGSLVERLCKDRAQGPSFLYGSRPPPNDTVWKAWEKNKFETNIYDRAHGGKEKEVDNSMSVDMTEKATELRIEAEMGLKLGDPKPKQRKDNTTFVVITGDRDMMPAVKKVLKWNIRVELWAWKSGISQEYLKLEELEGMLSVKYLNWIFKDISFTAYSSTHRSKPPVIGGKTIVLWGFDASRQQSICDQLLELGHLFWTTLSETETELFVEFPKVDDMEGIITKARQLLDDQTILSWIEYRARSKQDSTAGVTTVNMYELLPDDTSRPSSRATSPAVPAPSTHNNLGSKANVELANHPVDDAMNDAGGWRTVANQSDRGKHHRRIMNREQPCPHGFKCKKKGECGYRHTNEERNLFRDNPYGNLGMRKTRLCKFAPNCRNGQQCAYAHSEAEARCLDCKRTGHFQGDAVKCHLQVQERLYTT